MSLLKTSGLNAIAVGVKVGSGLLLNKLFSETVGPAGFAVIGHFQNILSVATTAATGAITTGVTKYTAEYIDDPQRQRQLWQTAVWVVVVCSVVVAIFMFLTHRWLAANLLHDGSFGAAFLWLGAGILPMSLNVLISAILIGRKEIGKYVAINVAGSLVGVVSAVILVTQWNLYGALAALVLAPSLTFLVTLAAIVKRSALSSAALIGPPDKRTTASLARFAIIAATSACVAPLAQVLIRDHLSSTFGLDAAGYWQGVWKVSDAYLMLVTMTMSTYFLPRFSEIKDGRELLLEVLRGYRFLLPLTATGALLIYQFRDVVITTLFTHDFAPMRALFGWQLAGDVIKVAGWLLGYLMVAQAMTTYFVATELLFTGLLVVLVHLCTTRLGLIGAPVAYCLTYASYWTCMALLCHRHSKTLGSGRRA
jgi:polysaccharide transporter, PST family